MPFLPFQILGVWFRGLLALALLGAGIYLAKRWYDEPRTTVVPQSEVAERKAPTDESEPKVQVVQRVSRWHLGLDWPTAYLAGAVTLLLLSMGGGSFGYPLLRRSEGTSKEGQPSSRGTEHRVKRPDGSELFATVYGPATGPTIVMTHGWSVDSTEWDYSRDHLAKSHRLILWDLPGLGRSSRPANNDFRLENLANDLDAIINLADGKPVVLLGHSIGGMINLTYCKLFPEALGSRVAGVIEVHTTYTNPSHTTKHNKLCEMLQEPVLVPLCHVMIWLSPVFWVMNWMSYFNGSLHRSTAKSSFCGTESREMLTKCAKYGAKAWPGVVARGMLAMFRYDATRTLDTIAIPSLIIAGDEDDLTRPEASVTMAESIAKATLHTLKPAKHMGHMEHHQEFVKMVNGFVTSCYATSIAHMAQ